MLEQFKRFLKDEDGISTVEIVVIIAVLVGIALIFKNAIVTFVNKLLNNILKVNVDPQNL
jgi:Flp pilus assembly pilin Flp